MRRFLIIPTLTLAALSMVALGGGRALAQGQPSQQLPLPPGGFKPPPLPPIKPYQVVAVTPPAPVSDASFVSFRNQLADIAKRKDRAALAKLVVAQNFFWIQDKDLADKRKSGIDNLAKAIDLDAKDGSGWDVVAAYALEPTGAPLPDRKGVICAPADPTVDPKAFEALTQATQTEPPEWGYPEKDGVEVRAAAQPNAPVVEKLGMNLVRMLPDSAPPDDPNQPSFLHVATPSGKAGFVHAEQMVPLGGDELCYIKDASGWKIAGYFGGASQ